MNVDIKFDDITENKLKSEEAKVLAVHLPFLGGEFYNKEIVNIRVQDAQEQLLDMIIDYPVHIIAGFLYAVVGKDKLPYTNLIKNVKSQVREMHDNVSDVLEDGKINFSEYEIKLFLSQLNDVITQTGIFYRKIRRKEDYKKDYENLLKLIDNMYWFVKERKYEKKEVY